MPKDISDVLSDETKSKIMELLQGAEKVMPEFAAAFQSGDMPAAREGVKKIRAAMNATCDGLDQVIDEIERQMAKTGEPGEVDISDV